MAWVNLSSVSQTGNTIKKEGPVHKDGEVLPSRSREAQPALQGHKLRPYQEKIVSKMLWAMDLPGNDIISLAQGSGKSLVIAEFAKQLGKPILILTPNKEITEQDIEKLEKVIPKEEIGVYSASLNSKEIRKITIGTIQSVAKHPEKFIGFDVVIVDEADLVNVKNLDTTYRKLFIQAGIKKVFGVTGTPYRQDVKYERWGKQSWMVNSITVTKMINRYFPAFWSRMLAVVNTDELLKEGYLCPIEYHDLSVIEHEQIPTNKTKTDFDLDKFDSIFNDYTWIASKIESLPHRSMIIYCSSVSQAQALQSVLKLATVVTATTTRKDRETAVRGLLDGQIRILLNVGIYTVGFDYPQLEAIVLLRPTRSLRLHSQILGRVSRKAEGKTKGHVYDFVSNVKTMGELDKIKVVKNPVNGKWDVVSNTKPEGWHMLELYRYQLKAKNKQEELL